MYKVLLNYDENTGNITTDDDMYVGMWVGLQKYIEPTLEVTNNTQSSGPSPIGVDAVLKLRENKFSLNEIHQLRASNLI